MKKEEGEKDGNFGVKKSTNRYAEMEPKFSCEKCDKKFRRKNDLTMHIANVHLKVFSYFSYLGTFFSTKAVRQF